MLSRRWGGGKRRKSLFEPAKDHHDMISIEITRPPRLAASTASIHQLLREAFDAVAAEFRVFVANFPSLFVFR